jgi:uncharacterized protein GlcG (DUF336 family)
MFNTKMSITNNISSHFSWGKTAALALLTVSVNALAADPAPNHNDATKKPPVPAAHGPTLESAVEAATAAIEACLDKDQKAGVSVVDSAGVVKVLLAADGASERGVLSSTNKAVTVLLKNGDEIIGAIGVGGAKIDEECALAGNDKIEARPK